MPIKHYNKGLKTRQLKFFGLSRLSLYVKISYDQYYMIVQGIRQEL